MREQDLKIGDRKIAIQAELEAWVLEGPDYDQQRLSDHKNLPTDQVSTGLWLRQVEVRAVLDEAYWNSPSEQEYGFIAGKRAWIVRDRITGQAHPGLLMQGWHSALLSSRALENLCGWAERVAMSHDGWLLSKAWLAESQTTVERPLQERPFGSLEGPNPIEPDVQVLARPGKAAK
jgi:hypothetical protein